MELFELSPKEERKIYRDLDGLMREIELRESLSGTPIDETTKELLKISLEKQMRYARHIAKQKFTPKKYRNYVSN